MAKVTIDTEWNLRKIALEAGSSSYLVMDEDQLVCNDITQKALDDALAAYNDVAERAIPHKYRGFKRGNVNVPASNADVIGALQIDAMFTLGLISQTTFELSNGQSIVLTSGEWSAFYSEFLTFRSQFYPA